MYTHTHTHTHTQDLHPTETIPLMDLNVTLNGQTGHPHGMQITALIRGKTRNYYVYSESGHVSSTYLAPTHFPLSLLSNVLKTWALTSCSTVTIILVAKTLLQFILQMSQLLCKLHHIQ